MSVFALVKRIVPFLVTFSIGVFTAGLFVVPILNHRAMASEVDRAAVEGSVRRARRQLARFRRPMDLSVLFPSQELLIRMVRERIT